MGSCVFEKIYIQISHAFEKTFQGKKDLVAVDNSEYDKETTEVSDESDEEAQEHSSSDLDSEDERRRYYGQLFADLLL